MPRAPKTCRRTEESQEVSKAGRKAAKGGDSTSKVVEGLVQSFKSWVSTGQGTASLPLELIEKLSHRIWEVKMSSWKGETSGKDVDEVACVAGLDDAMAAVFKALERKCLTAGDLEKNRSKASVAKLQNCSAGLVLAAMVMDLSAFQQASREQGVTSPQIQPGEEVVAGAMAFLWHQARFALPTLLEGKASSEAASTCTGLARTIRSIHHILAARRYTSHALPAACLAHKAAPMAVQCMTLAASLASSTPSAVKSALSTLGEASSDLLVGLSGYGCAESALQSFAMNEFSKIATLSSMFVNSLSANSKGSGRGAPHGPSFLALVLRAIGAPLLPIGLYSKELKDLSQMAVERVAAADTRAGHLAAVVIQHSLLESERSEAMHALVQQLSAVCGDPFWASAPLYALRLVGALSRVAGASRMIDLDCSQREEATRLLAKVAEALTASAQEARQIQTCRCCGAEAGPDCELCALKAWAPESKRQGKSIKTKDPLALVVSLLDAAAVEDGLLAPTSTRWGAGDLQGSALSASDSRCNAAALLCLSLASPMAGKKRKDAKNVAPVKAPEWNLQAWASHSCVQEASNKTPSSKEIRCAISLYRRLQWSDPTSILSRARMSALECLLSLARSNPLAHVRRQALCGLSACCAADPQLIASRCVAEVVAAGLQDEAAFARLASLDLVAQLQCPEGDMKTVVMPRLTELRMVVRSKLSDPSVLVRRAAFRAAGVWLEECEDQASQIQEAGEMLRRLRSETAQIRGQALMVLERVVFAKTKGSKQQIQETILKRLCKLHGHNGVGGAGIRDVLAAHCKAIEGSNLADAAATATAAMEEIASCALKSLPNGSEPENLELHLSLLEQLSLERPAAFHKHLNRFAQWLDEQTDPETPESLVLPIAACNILAQVLPSWTENASVLSKQKIAHTLTEKLSCLVDEETAPAQDLGQLARVVVKCLAVVVEYLSLGARDLLMGHFGRSIRLLSEAMQHNQLSHGKMCRHTWIVGSLLEFLDAKSMELLGEAVAQVSSKNGAVEIVSKAAVVLLSDCCLRGPAAAKPAMIPALGFALRRFPHLLDVEDGSHGGSTPLTVLRHGLSALGSSNAASVLCLRATETFAGLAACYQEAAETNGPNKKKDSSASVAAQKLATLQPELMAVLQAEEKIIQQALRGFRSLCDLGVIHPASAIPGIITVTVAGTKAAARHARQLLLRLVESGPPLLAQRCGVGLRMAAQQLCQTEELDVYGESWRFGPLCEAYAEFLDGKHQRDQFLCSLVSETFSEAEISEGSAVLRLQLIAGLLARLPLSKEAELARIVHSVVQFLTLKVAPYLTLDEQEKADNMIPAPGRVTCAAAVVLHKLCTHWLELVGADFAKQMRETWGSTLSLSSSDFDQALPIAFSRQNLPDLQGIFRKIHAVSECGDEGLLAEIETDSPLLNSKAAARVLAIKQQSRKRAVAEDLKGNKKSRRHGPTAAAKAAAAATAAQADAMSKAAAAMA